MPAALTKACLAALPTLMLSGIRYRAGPVKVGMNVGVKRIKRSAGRMVAIGGGDGRGVCVWGGVDG